MEANVFLSVFLVAVYLGLGAQLKLNFESSFSRLILKQEQTHPRTKDRQTVAGWLFGTALVSLAFSQCESKIILLLSHEINLSCCIQKLFLC